MVEESLEPGGSVSLVARRHCLNSTLLFTWRGLVAHGAFNAMAAGEEVVPAADHRALQEQPAENTACRYRHAKQCRRVGLAVDTVWMKRDACWSAPSRMDSVGVIGGRHSRNRSQPSPGSKRLIAAASRTVLGPRSCSHTTPSWLIMNDLMPVEPYCAG